MPLCKKETLVYPASICDTFPTLYWFLTLEEVNNKLYLNVRANTFTATNIPFMNIIVSYTQFGVAYQPGRPQTGTLIPDQGSLPIVVPAQGANVWTQRVPLNPNLNTLSGGLNAYRVSYRFVVNYPCNGTSTGQVIDFTYTS